MAAPFRSPYPQGSRDKDKIWLNILFYFKFSVWLINNNKRILLSGGIMNKKMQECFKPHIYMHSLFGFGLGLLVATLWTGIQHWWIGVVVMVVAVLWDMSRKA
jgi:hypothetical protein